MKRTTLRLTESILSLPKDSHEGKIFSSGRVPRLTMFARDNLSSSERLVRKEGFEPPRPFGHKILSLARLPVPPLPQWWLPFYRVEKWRSTGILVGIGNR